MGRKFILPSASQEAKEVGVVEMVYVLRSREVCQVGEGWRTRVWQDVHLASGRWAHLGSQTLYHIENFLPFLKGTRVVFI